MNFKEKIGPKGNPLSLKTPHLSSEYSMHVEEKEGKDLLVCTIGKTVLHYDLRCIEHLHRMLKTHCDWMELGSKDEKQDTREGTLEHWGRSTDNPVGGWYGLKRNFRGRFGMYISPLIEAMGLGEVSHEKRGNKMKAI